MTAVFGQIYAPAYDTLYEDKDYDGEVALLEQIFERYANRPVHNILDLGCGTGNHAIRLASRGYEVTGVDRSGEMLAIANRKTNEHSLKLRFLQGDMRSLDLSGTFDAVLMMFGVLGYQLEDADILGALWTARRHLRVDGLLVFDVWYGPAVVAQGPEVRSRTVQQSDTTWLRNSSGTLDPHHNLCHVAFQLQQMQIDTLVSRTVERHTVRYFFPEEITRFLQGAGFYLLRLGAFPSFDTEPNDGTWNAMAVAAAA